MSLSKARSINIAILALGGQGGGVLVKRVQPGFCRNTFY